MSVNILQNILATSLKGTLMGPVVASQSYDEVTQMHMNVFTWEVANGSTLDGPLPFGIFGQIEQMNINKAKLVVRMHPAYDGVTPVEFPEVCTSDKQIDTHLEASIVCRKVVPVAQAAEAGEGIWESIVQPLDQTHGLRITRKTYTILEQPEYVKTKEDPVPARFRAGLVWEQTSTIVEGEAAMPTLGADEDLHSEQQLTVHTKRVTARELASTVPTKLTGQIAYVEGTVADLTHELLPSTTTPAPTADTGLLMVESEVKELADGRYEKSSVEVDSWPVLEGSVYDDLLDAQLLFTKQFVAPPDFATPSVLAETGVEYTPVNEDRTLKQTFTVPTATLNAYKKEIPIKVSLKLPRVLKSVNVTWHKAVGQSDQDASWAGAASGTSPSLSANLSDQAHASASVMPDLQVEIETPWGDDVDATGVFMFMEEPVTVASIKTKLLPTVVLSWPVFKPVSRTITLKGQKVGITVNASVSAHKTKGVNLSEDWGKTDSESFDISTNTSTVIIPPTLHGAITFTGGVIDSETPSAAAIISVVMDGRTTAASRTKSKVCEGSVSPDEFLATSPADIPRTGIYLTNYRIEPYKWGYARVYAELVNMAQFA